jgi:hypothetical protein
MTTTTLPLFSGDWEWNETLDAWEVGYPAVSYGVPWNGWATPVVSPEVLAVMVARNTFLRSAGLPDLDRWEWVADGSVVRVLPFDVADTDPEAPGYATDLYPNDEGNYDLSVLGYVWTLVDEDENVVRTVTS